MLLGGPGRARPSRCRTSCVEAASGPTGRPRVVAGTRPGCYDACAMCLSEYTPHPGTWQHPGRAACLRRGGRPRAPRPEMGEPTPNPAASSPPQPSAEPSPSPLQATSPDGNSVRQPVRRHLYTPVHAPRRGRRSAPHHLGRRRRCGGCAGRSRRPRALGQQPHAEGGIESTERVWPILAGLLPELCRVQLLPGREHGLGEQYRDQAL